MSRFHSTILWVSLSMALSACGGGDANPIIQMGGSIQGRRLILSPAVLTLVGSSTSGSTDAASTAARFWNPKGVTTDGTNLYVADSGNNTIRKIGIAFGNVSTMAGSVGISGATNDTGRAASFSNPQGITTDGANLYVTDSGNKAIRKIVIATGTVTTLAGSAASFSNPQGITTDGANLYVADSGNNTIRKVVIATGVVTTIAGSASDPADSLNGTGTAARFNNPVGITTDGGNLYVTDSGNDTIRKISLFTGAVTTLAGSPGNPGDTGIPTIPVNFNDGTGGFAKFTAPSAITSDGANLFVTDDGSTIRKVVIATGVVTTLAGNPGIFGATDGTGDSISLSTGVPVLMSGDARFWLPQGITTDGKNLFVADSVNNMIRKVY